MKEGEMAVKAEGKGMTMEELEEREKRQMVKWEKN